ncbi:hypothetical protein COT78_00655 [Candidatus Berkelbacteria bacterium CG10_big_fil_rev_8_21_14_0_10_43_13]|uniref:Uncharacterized protein n=1 Tax=Candidatus Berkelbacteria bacterium CG10_big_fil_rev_8_21_14_0_10_43_13 TaxID=1974514 RepID=A0A2H0W7C1_9BACT|nr:MAG: hypothetical protein COT78_00655 [Candidatus Berkelbacteria bacterium CG10_big_fil_rev_8_21_14_0_10_43_13]
MLRGIEPVVWAQTISNFGGENITREWSISLLEGHISHLTFLRLQTIVQDLFRGLKQLDKTSFN